MRKQYTLIFNEEAGKDMRRLSPDVAKRVSAKIKRLCDGLAGDVKRLTNFTPEYRLRVGDWRVMFEVDGGRIIVHHVSHRSDAYQ
jgi:mRNA interferase RelE/StbE